MYKYAMTHYDVTGECTRAIYNGDLAKVRLLIENGSAFHVVNRTHGDCGLEEGNPVSCSHEGVLHDGESFFNFAAKVGQLDIFKYLYSLDPTILSADASCAEDAAAEGHLEIVQYLVSLRAGIAVFGCLYEAASNGHTKIVQYLIEELGANVNARGDMIVSEVSASGNIATVRYLVGVGADIYNKKNAWCLQSAINRDNEAITCYLVALGVYKSECIEIAANFRCKVLPFLIARGAGAPLVARTTASVRDTASARGAIVARGAVAVYFWWVPRCYDRRRRTGRRMARRNYTVFRRIRSL